MGLFSRPYKPKSSDPGAFDTSKLTKNQNVPTYNREINLYQPTTQQTDFDPNAKTAYSGVQENAISRLGEILQYGGYSPQQQQELAAPGLVEINRQAKLNEQAAKNEMASRGLFYGGQTAEQLRRVGEGTQSAIGNLMSQIQQQGAQMVSPAITQVQTAQTNLQQLQQKNAEANANLRQQHEQLAANLSVSSVELQRLEDTLNATINMDNASREVEITKLMNQYNLGRAEIQQAYQDMLMKRDQANRDRTASFISNLLGGVIGAGGAIGGAAIQAGGAVKAATIAAG